APLQQYQGQRVAALPGEINQASGIFNNLANTSSVDNVQKYINPQVAEVESKALGALEDQRVQAIMGNADRANAAKAFGGSRSAIVDAVTNSQTAKEAGILSAGLRRDSYDAALAASSADRAAQAGYANNMLTTGALRGAHAQ